MPRPEGGRLRRASPIDRTSQKREIDASTAVLAHHRANVRHDGAGATNSTARGAHVRVLPVIVHTSVDSMTDRSDNATTHSVSPKITEQLGKSGRELDRLHALLTEAITALISHFEALAELNESQRDVTGQALAQSIDAAVRATLESKQRTLDASITEHLNGALIALQFQDMSSQLINHVRERITLMKLEIASPGQSELSVRGDSPVRSDGAFAPPTGARRGGAVELF
jgi:hypothetical protein